MTSLSASPSLRRDGIGQWAAQVLPRFEKVLAESSPFQAKGILNSEMLAVCSAVEGVSATHIIESGRAPFSQTTNL